MSNCIGIYDSIYCILFHVTSSNLRVIVDSIVDHKQWFLTHAVSCHIFITVISVVKLIHASVWAFCFPFDQAVVLSPIRTLTFVVTETLLGAPG